MPKLLNINKLTFGSDDAEFDEKHGFLDKVFLKTSIFHRAIESQRELVLGRKGTGKSAICLMLKKALEGESATAILVTPKLLSQQKLEQLKTTSVNKDETYILSWKYGLLVTIAKRILETVSRPKAFKQTKEAYKLLDSVHKFLIDNEEIKKSLLQRFSKGASIISKLSVKAFGIEGSAETRQLQAQKDVASELEKFQVTLEELFAELSKQKVIILIDRVDEVWNQTEESELMIIGLIKAVHDLNTSLRQTHFILFLRSDIYDTLKFNDADKLHSLEERLDWKDEDLKRLIANRGKVSAGLTSDNINTLWNTIFDEEVNDERSFNYLLDRTLKRPRELIQFCNSALAEAQDHKHDHILAKDILAAEKQYSNWKLKDLASEFAVQYPYLDELLGMFQGFKAKLSYIEFDKRYKETKTQLSKYPDLQTINTEKMLQILFIIGFLGTKLDGESVFVYDNSLILLAHQEVIVVHLAYHLALGLRKNSFNVSGGIKANRDLVIGNQINVSGSVIGRDNVTQVYYESELISSRELERFVLQLNELSKEETSIKEKIAAYPESESPVRLKYRLQDVEDQIKVTELRINSVLKSRKAK